MKGICIYHNKCMDGLGASWAVWHKFGDNLEYYGADHRRAGEAPDLPYVKGRDVIIVDFSYPREIVESIQAEAASFLLLDHHATAMEALADLPNCHFDMERSGAGMAWDYFHPDEERPWIINYIEDRDLWRHQLPFSKPVNSYLQSLEYSFGALNKAEMEGLKTAMEIGASMEQVRQAYVRATRRLHRRMTFAGHEDIPVVNAPYWSISELVESLAYGAKFAVGWHQDEQGKFKYSLRSAGDFHVGELAKQFGGGGHPQSAGFSSDTMVHG